MLLRGEGADLGLLGLGEVLVRRAVAVGVDRDALAWSSAAGRRAARQRIAERVAPARREAGQQALGGVDVVAHHDPGALLVLEREVRADIAEERPRRVGEVVPVGRQALDGALARSQHISVADSKKQTWAEVQEVVRKEFDKLMKDGVPDQELTKTC